MTEITPKDGAVAVTGAGSGLGRAMAQQFCAQGFQVAGLGRRADALEDTAGLCGNGFHPRVCDVSSPDAVAQCFASLVADLGPLAVLVNNAALYPRRDFLSETPQSFAQTMDVNLGGLVACSHAALQDMVPRGAGRILNVATFADLNPLPASSAYSVSKGAARILTRALIADLADRFPGIVISDWMPGMLRTRMGIPDGLPPETSAAWGVKLALMADQSLTGTTFEMNKEILPPRGLKGKIKDLVLMQRRKPRLL